MNDMMSMYYEDFNTLLFMAYEQNLTEEGRNQQQAEELQDQLEDVMDQAGPALTSYDNGLAIQRAIEEQRKRSNNRGR